MERWRRSEHGDDLRGGRAGGFHTRPGDGKHEAGRARLEQDGVAIGGDQGDVARDADVEAAIKRAGLNVRAIGRGYGHGVAGRC